jgi:hypothetical protein
MTDEKPQTSDATSSGDASTLSAAAEARPSQKPRILFPARPGRRIPAKSAMKAKKAFAKFSLSKFNGKPMPPNYVAAGENPAAAQKRLIVSHLKDLTKKDTSNRAITVSLPSKEIKRLLPSFNQKAGTIDLDDLMALIERNMKGTEFFANGNPILNRLSIQSQVEQIINSVKGAKK